MILTRRLRNLPITAVRLIRAAKYFFAEHIKVPHDVEAQQVIAIHRDISKPLLGAAESQKAGLSLDFIQNLLRSMAGLRVHELHPWLLSSAYIFAYFVISRHKNDSICMEAYACMHKGETPTSEVIKHVVNDIIFKCGNLTDDENCKGLTQNQIFNFRRSLQRDYCQNELQVLVAWPEDLGLICSSNECGNMEKEMLHYFKLFEIKYGTVDAIDKLIYLLNEDTEESSVNNFSNSIKDNSNSPSLKQSKNIDNKLENCSLQDENQVENITKRFLRPRIKYKKDESRITRSKSKIILINSDEVDKESQDNSKEVMESNDIGIELEFSCRRILPFVGKTLQKPLYGGPERPIEINYSNDTPETDLINHTMQLDIETSSVTSNNNDTVIQERNNDLQDIPVNKENEIVKSLVSSEAINEKLNYSSNVNKSLDSSNCNEKLQSVSTAKALFNAKADISIKDCSNITKSALNNKIICLNNENGRVNLISELSNKNRKPEPISQDSKEKADTISSNIDTNLDSSKDINRKSSEQYKSRGTAWRKNENSFLQKEYTALMGSTAATTSKILAPTTIMGNKKRDSHSGADQASQANQNNFETDHLIGQLQDPQIEKKTIKNRLKFNSSTMDSPVFTATTNSNFTASNNNSGSTSKKASNTVMDPEFQQSILNSKVMNQLPQNPSHVQSRTVDSSSSSSAMDIPISTTSTSSKSTPSKSNTSSTLKREPITVVDLDFEPTMLNSKRINQSPQEFPTVKKMCFESRSNSCAMDFPIPVTTTSSNLTASNNNSDSTVKIKSITVIDLDLEPCILNSNAMSQPLQDSPNVETIRPDTTFKSPAMDIPIPESTTNSSFTAEYKDSNSYMKEITTAVENPDLENVGIRKDNTLGRSISGIKMSSNTASLPTLTPGPLAILFANSQLSKYSKRKTAAAIGKTTPWTNGSPSSQKKSQPQQNTVDNFSRRSIPMDWQSKKASINEPVNGLIFTTGEKETPTSQASFTEMNGVNLIEQDNPSQSQQCPLQDQQQPSLFASCQEVNDNTFSSRFNNDSSKSQTNIQQNTDTVNVDGNFSIQAGLLPLNPRLTSSTVSDRTSTIHLAMKNKIDSAYQEDILHPTLSTDMSTVGDQFPLSRADEEYSNASSVKSRLLTKVRITPLQQPNFEFNGKRCPTHCSDVQHYNLVNNTSTPRSCLPAQQQQQSMRYIFNSATANSTVAVAGHDVNEVFTPASKVWQAPVNLDNLHYFCDYCPIQSKFESAELLYQHVNDVHNYSCQLCQNRYPTRQALLQHIDKHTENTSAKQVIAIHSDLCKLDLEYSLIFGPK